MPYDDLHCSFDKITRCVELGIDVLVDDSPVNIAGPARRASPPATIVAPLERGPGRRGWRDRRRTGTSSSASSSRVLARLD